MFNLTYIGRCDCCGREIYKGNKYYDIKRPYGWDWMVCEYCVTAHDDTAEDNVNSNG